MISTDSKSKSTNKISYLHLNDQIIFLSNQIDESSQLFKYSLKTINMIHAVSLFANKIPFDFLKISVQLMTLLEKKPLFYK